MAVTVVEMWTDGACKGNPGPGGWGALLRWNGFEKEQALEEIARVRLVTREGMMEKRMLWGEDILRKRG